MIAQIPGASMRAMLIGLLVITPSLLLGDLVSGPSETAVLLALIVAAVTFLEYRTNYPSFLEFRDAPPINRYLKKQTAVAGTIDDIKFCRLFPANCRRPD